MQFQYFSDVHVEFFTKLKQINSLNIKSISPYLIIAGDIGNPNKAMYELFIEHVSKKFQKIFVISGNHEYYETRKKSHPNWIKKIDENIGKIINEYKNVIFLQNTSYDIEDSNITIFGATFWSKINPNEPVKDFLSDYSLIPHFTAEKSTELFEESVSKLTEELNNKPTRDFIVVSHHMPSCDLISPKYKHCNINSAFASDIKINNIDVENIAQIKSWVFGHTHCCIEKNKFHCNPLGYIGEIYQSNPNKTFIL